jgi:uncharacterized phiE125 gp8 family phage protein
MSHVLVTGPAKRPVSIGEVKGHALISHDRDDPLIYGWIGAAVDDAQAETGRQLITATYDEYFDRWPACADARGERAFRLELPPVQSVTSVKYLDTAGALQTLDPANYRVDTVSLRPRVVIKPDASLPALADQSQAIVVRYVAGYGTEPDNVPEKIRQWIILHVATRSEFREALADRAPAELPRWFVDGLLDDYRLPEVA